MDTKIHVVHVIGALRTGGAERQVVNFLLAADRSRFRFTVLCLTTLGEFAPELEAAGIPVRLFRVRTRQLPLDVWRLARWMRREEVRVVHSHMHAASLWGRLAGLLAGVPVFVTSEHGKENWKGGLRVLLDRWLTRVTWRHLAVSQDIVNIRVGRERYARDRVVLMPNGVPIPPVGRSAEVGSRVRAALGIARGRPVVGTVGRVVSAKAYPDFAAALVILRGRFPDICWLQIGDGPLLAELETTIRELGLGENVLAAGLRDDIADLLQAMDVWVMSSIREGLPVSLLEAMAAERPIVATTAGGIPDAVTDGESALLVAPGNPQAMAGAVARLLEDHALAARLAAAARVRAARDYSIEAVARRVEAVYTEGLAARGATTR